MDCNYLTMQMMC